MIVVVLDSRHCPGSGIKVSVTLPLCPDGLKLLPLTPAPDQFPVMLPCVVGNEMGAAISHIADRGVRLTVVGALTVIVIVLLLAHCPELGAKVKVIAPLNPKGSNELPETPEPLHVPVIPLWVVLRVIGLSAAQSVVGVTESVGVTAAFTVTVVVLDEAHCPAVGVKVKTIGPLKPVGVKVVPDTPEPDHVPVNPLGVALRVTGLSKAHKVPKDAKVTGGAGVMVTCWVAVVEQLLASLTVTV